jgi:hypothetical protein
MHFPGIHASALLVRTYICTFVVHTYICTFVVYIHMHFRYIHTYICTLGTCIHMHFRDAPRSSLPTCKNQTYHFIYMRACIHIHVHIHIYVCHTPRRSPPQPPATKKTKTCVRKSSFLWKYDRRTQKEPYTHIHTHTHTKTHTHAHTHTHTCIQAHMLVRTHTHTHTHTHTYKHTHTYEQVHTCTYAHTNSNTHTYTHTHTFPMRLHPHTNTIFRRIYDTS